MTTARIRTVGELIATFGLSRARAFGPDRYSQERLAPGAFKAADRVPLTIQFDASKIVGYAQIREDGTIETGTSAAVVGIGFRVVREHDEEGVRVLDEIDLLTVAIEGGEV